MPINYKKIAEENIKKYGTDIGRYGAVLLAHLYSDRTHFIYEILQNAEDAGARAGKRVRVNFHLFKDRLEIRHNGKLFDEADVRGICGLVEGTKEKDFTQIGKFGIGFKSVYAYTNTPKVFSGEEAFCIENYVLPHSVTKEANIQLDETLFIFPFDHAEVSHEQAFKEIANRLHDIGAKTLLFLTYIEEITWHVDEQESGNCIREISAEKSHKKVYVISNVGGESVKDEEWLVFERPLNGSLKIEAAFKLGKDKNGKKIIVQEPDSKLVVFFPTEKDTFLNFLLQGPYKTTPNRESIPLDDAQNKVIIEETGNLIAESLSVIKDLGYLDTNFLSLLPINPENKESKQIYSVMYEKVKEKFLSDELLPTPDGIYSKVDDALLARGKELTEFLDKNDIQELFSKQCWLDTNITYDKTRELRDYLISELKVGEIDFESFARKITVEFLQAKSNEWMADFYSRLLDQPALWRDRGYATGILRTKPIIRLENGEHIAPFDDNGKVQVYLPTETKSQYKTVKHILTENENSLKFLKELGLAKPDLFAEIKEFILPKYQSENPIKDERYLEDIEKLQRAYETIPVNKKTEFIDELSKAFFIDSVDHVSKVNRLKKPSETYFPDEDLTSYFDGHPVYFVTGELCARVGKGKLKSFLKDIGVEDKPRRIEINANLSREEERRLRGNYGCTQDIYQKDYEYEGLENFLQQITIDKSYLLWKLLLKNVSLNSWTAQEFFEGEYRWFYRTEHCRSFVAKFAKKLRQEAWLVDKNNNFRKSTDITFLELSDVYIKESPNINILIKALEFKPDIINQLPEDFRKKLEIVQDLTLEQLKELVDKFKQPPTTGDETWMPEIEPDKVDVKIKEVVPDEIITPDLTGQVNSIITVISPIPPTGIPPEPPGGGKQTLSDRKAIGKWGEKYVYNALKEKYQKQGDIIERDSGFKVINADEKQFEVIWLNMHQDTGKGCDFVIREHETETEYIEVKAKIEESEELISVTGTQWEFARKLFEQNKGEKYSFYVVLNAGKENAQIHILKNPIRLWKEGKLYAHPVNFKL